MFYRLPVLGSLLLLISLFTNVIADSAGCGKTPTTTSGTKSMTVNGKSRQYIIRVPENYNKTRPYRLVFGLHWYGGTMTDVATGQTVQRNVWDHYGLRRLANESTIFIAPQGLNNGWGNTNGEDVTFVDQIIKEVENDLCVNEKLRFATGFSYGMNFFPQKMLVVYTDAQRWFHGSSVGLRSRLGLPRS
jgi:poly(3-hydroxybutyrate) depolymerase